MFNQIGGSAREDMHFVVYVAILFSLHVNNVCALHTSMKCIGYITDT